MRVFLPAGRNCLFVGKSSATVEMRLHFFYVPIGVSNSRMSITILSSNSLIANFVLNKKTADNVCYGSIKRCKW